ncbi:putative nuclease HARBI1 [Prorops nasuta]|uniref:putative nuclease HARBI1 n=1 Tax=Prorops nasuta TaxID=863751 RepID=UPI0034CDE898
MDGNSAILKMVIMSSFEQLLSSSDNDSSSDEEELFNVPQFIVNGICSIPRNSIQKYVTTTVHLYTDLEFKRHFRLECVTFKFLLELLEPYLQRQSKTSGRHPISPESQLLIALWMFVTPNSYRCISDRFNISKSTAWTCVQKVVKALYAHRHTFIQWPSTQDARRIYTNIEANHGFPKCIGAIDGTHIRIAAPKENANAYINRKGYCSIQLQVTCDNDLNFTHCYCGQAGSVHDMRVFRLSKFENMLNSTNFPDDSHILGDSAYGLHKYLIVPLRDNGRLTEAEINFNKCHSSARMMVERSLGLLKGRFRSILDKLPMTRTELIPKYVIACCILHNICIIKKDLINIPIIVDPPTCEEQLPNAHTLSQQKKDAITKRNNIMHFINRRN